MARSSLPVVKLLRGVCSGITQGSVLEHTFATSATAPSQLQS
ncbi:unnamed protein product [Linum tenue]|uniref:Uncharacterized protein n=1 Tax=Linum tenue TaxID=586396 RepID=A0AAV0QZX6_9ROSI|nr:unnamed protein product [Linum tenue]